jgi:MOSC domain-containing protein YiiM
VLGIARDALGVSRFPYIREPNMQVVSINVGKPREVLWRGIPVQTSIFKDPIHSPVMIRQLNLDGDQQSDLTVHGGVHKAVYGYAVEHYDYWRQQLPAIAFVHGHFGENLTTEGLSEHSLCIGDQLQVGSAILTVTQPRLPCYKLTIRFDREDMIKRFLISGHSGFYFSVAQEGEVRPGAPIQFLQRDPNQLTVAELNHLFLSKRPDSKTLDRALKVDALPLAWKEDLQLKATTRQS